MVEYLCPRCCDRHLKSLPEKRGEDPPEGVKAKDPSADTESSKDTISTVLQVVGYTSAGVAIVCAVPMVAGFGASGIVVGSWAALWQSAIGNVVAGSTFATLQSLGATGTFVAGTSGGASIAGGAFGVDRLRAYWRGKQASSKDQDSVKLTSNEKLAGGEVKVEAEGNQTLLQVECTCCGKTFILHHAGALTAESPKS